MPQPAPLPTEHKKKKVHEAGEEGTEDETQRETRRAQELLATVKGRVLTSATPERQVLLPFSFSVVQELSLRETRYKILFAAGGPLEQVVRKTAVFGEQALSDAEVEEMISRLQNSCRLADRLGDSVTEFMTGNSVPHPSIVAGFLEQDLTSQFDPSKYRPGSPLSLATAVNDNDSVDQNPRNYITKVRLSQIALLRSLPTLDLVFLANLVSISGQAYQSLYRHRVDSDPSFWDRVTAFQETLLRQGASVTLWALFGAKAAPIATAPATSNDGHAAATSDIDALHPEKAQPLEKFIEDAVRGTLLELRAWEMGTWPRATRLRSDGTEESSENTEWGLLPGLQMTVWGVLRKRLGANLSEDDGIGSRMDKLLLGAIKRPVKAIDATTS